MNLLKVETSLRAQTRDFYNFHTFTLKIVRDRWYVYPWGKVRWKTVFSNKDNTIDIQIMNFIEIYEINEIKREKPKISICRMFKIKIRKGERLRQVFSFLRLANNVVIKFR